MRFVRQYGFPRLAILMLAMHAGLLKGMHPAPISVLHRGAASGSPLLQVRAADACNADGIAGRRR